MLDRDQLKEAQAPLKERYREDAEAALVTLSAEGELGAGVSCSLSTGRALGEAGLHPAAGGGGSVDRDAPVGFRAIRLSFDLRTEADEAEVATRLKLTERCCVVLRTPTGSPELTTTVAEPSRAELSRRSRRRSGADPRNSSHRSARRGPKKRKPRTVRGSRCCSD